MIPRKFSLFFLFFLLLAFNGFSQLSDSIRVDEYYFGTKLSKVLTDFKVKYKIPIDYDSATVSPYKVDILFTNSKAKTALDMIMRDNKNLAWFIDKDNRVKIVSKGLEPTATATTPVEAKHFEGASEKKGVTVSGIIKDKKSGETLPFATIMVASTKKYAATNVDGYFTLFNVPTDTSTLQVQYVGYKPQTFYLTPKMNLSSVNIGVDQAVTELEEVKVTSERNNILQASGGVGEVKMSPIKLAELPSLGDKDVFRTFQLMPGVSGSNEASSGLYVRGGTPDQNLILFDGFTVYHQEHLFGVFSAFNANAIKDITLYKGGFEAKYGGRVSSVVDIVGKTGNTKKVDAGIDLSFIGINGYVEVPLGGKGSVMIAARRSFKTFLYDKFFDAYNSSSSSSSSSSNSGSGGNAPGGGRGDMMGRNQESAQPKSYFYDLNGKVTYNVTDKDLLSLSIFNGQDDLDNSRDINRSGGGGASVSGSNTDLSKWGNFGTSAKWSRKWNDRFYMNNLVSFSNYYSIRDMSDSRSMERDGEATESTSGSSEENKLFDYSFKSENEYKFSQSHQLEFGVNATEYNITYTYTMNDTLDILNTKNTAFLGAAYIQDRFTLFQKLHMLPGARLTYFEVTKKAYAEPRFQGSYDITRKVKIKGSWGVFHQFINRVIREDISSGSRDIWILSDAETVPICKAIHYIGGASYETSNWLYDAEVYYKDISGLSEYSLRFTPNFGAGTNFNTLFYKGNGYSRGLDLLVQRKFGKYTGWVSYTYGQTRYKFSIYGDDYFPASHDVTHEFKIVNTYTIGRWNLAATWIYATGKPYTEPVGTFSITQPDGTTKSYTVTSDKNGTRYPNYHRLDVSAKYNFLLGDYIKGNIGASIFNVYNRKNIWYKEFEFDETGLNETNVTLLGFTPNLSLSLQLR